MDDVAKMTRCEAPCANWTFAPPGSLATNAMCMRLLTRQLRRRRSLDIGLNLLVFAEGLTGLTHLAMAEGPLGGTFDAASSLMSARVPPNPIVAQHVRVVRSKRVGPTAPMLLL